MCQYVMQMSSVTLEKVELVKVADIGIPEERITSVHTPELIEEIFASLDQDGQNMPINVVRVEGQLILTDGLHRIKWAILRKVTELRAQIKEGTMSTVLIDNFVQNKKKGTSDPIGEGIVLRELMKEENLSLGEGCRRLVVSKQWGSSILKVLSLEGYILNLVREKKLYVKAAFHISQLDDVALQREVAEHSVYYKYSVQQTRDRVKTLMEVDYTPEAGDHEFSPQGEPQVIFPQCELCKGELKHEYHIINLCRKDYDDVKAAFATLDSPPAPQPSPPHFAHQPPIAPPEQMACNHPYMVSTDSGFVACRDCGLNLGQIVR